MDPSRVVPVALSTMNGRKMSDEKSVFRKRMGMTALSFSDFFFSESYTPKKAADMNASINHMVTIISI
jgi:hypothetical protein